MDRWRSVWGRLRLRQALRRRGSLWTNWSDPLRKLVAGSQIVGIQQHYHKLEQPSDDSVPLLSRLESWNADLQHVVFVPLELCRATPERVLLVRRNEVERSILLDDGRPTSSQLFLLGAAWR